MVDDSIYEDRAVLFLDILGFSELVKTGRERDILSVLEVTDEVKKKYPFVTQGDMDISTFSDSIVVSAKIDDGIGVARVSHYAGYLAWKFLELGILTRGGIAVGKMYHKNGTAFGPAFIEAHELESKLAIYPRILATTDVHRSFIEYEAKTRPQMISVSQLLFREDFDLQFHIDLTSMACIGTPMSFIENSGINNDGIISLTFDDINLARKKCLDLAINKNMSQEKKHLVKLGWLKKYMSGYQG
jgi:hypothetical protein